MLWVICVPPDPTLPPGTQAQKGPKANTAILGLRTETAWVPAEAQAIPSGPSSPHTFDVLLGWLKMGLGPPGADFWLPLLFLGPGLCPQSPGPRGPHLEKSIESLRAQERPNRRELRTEVDCTVIRRIQRQPGGLALTGRTK